MLDPSSEPTEERHTHREQQHIERQSIAGLAVGKHKKFTELIVAKFHFVELFN